MKPEECVQCKYGKGPRKAFQCELGFPSSIVGELCQEFVSVYRDEDGMKKTANIVHMDCSKCEQLYNGDGTFSLYCVLNGDALTGKECAQCPLNADPPAQPGDAVNSPAHYVGNIEVIDYLRDKLTPAEFTGFCMGNVLKYSSRWRKKDGLQDLKKAAVYLGWAIENEEKHA